MHLGAYKDAPCKGRDTKKGASGGVVRGAGSQVIGSPGKGQYNGVGGSGDPAAPAYVKQNNCRPGAKNI